MSFLDVDGLAGNNPKLYVVFAYLESFASWSDGNGPGGFVVSGLERGRALERRQNQSRAGEAISKGVRWLRSAWPNRSRGQTPTTRMKASRVPLRGNGAPT